MPEDMVSPSCPICGGGGLNGVELCTECMGTGVLPLRGVNLYLRTQFSEIRDKCNDILDKCNDIFEKVNV